ncbi:MAG: phosphoribosylformylglycinamidine synthase subunit PurL [Thermoplasmata archaeon]
MLKKLDYPFEIYEIHIRSLSDEELLRLNELMNLGLNYEELHRLRTYFKDLERDPTDVELQAIAQAWSEHCCYKSSKNLLKKYIFGIDAPQNIVVIQDDAAVVEFDKTHAYVFKMESHNHPSFVEPYGGAATGVGGIIRDVLNMGAKPIALVDPLFFGPLDYPYEKLKEGVKHPIYLFNGVVAGIRDYGNRVGIPTIGGMTYFHSSFLNNILVNVGCIGIAKKTDIVRSRIDKVGYNLILVGGKTGRDGIHGVNFASKVLSNKSESEKTAVQLGNPIIKEPLIKAVLEANSKKLITGMKDLGGGGLSSVIGEMCLAGGVGANVYLDRVPLKEPNMAPWEIWVSESQERLMLAVSEKNTKKVLDIFSLWDVEATVIGKTIDSERLNIYYSSIKILDLDLVFLTSGPLYCRPSIVKYPAQEKVEMLPSETNYKDSFLKLLSSSNIASKEFIIRQYDHEVKGRTVIKPLQGKIGMETHGDAAVLKPLDHSNKGLAVTTDVNPRLTELDPYWGSIAAVDEAVRNLVSVGARPHSFADNLNFGNPEDPVVMGQLEESVRGLGDIARFLKIPYVSGNVSLYNANFGVSIVPTPTIMAIGIVENIKYCLTSDLKDDGNLLYVIGATKAEMGGSEYYALRQIKSTNIPKSNFKNLRDSIDKMLVASNKKVIRSAHDISQGGLAIAIAEMAIGGNIGAKINLKPLGILRTDFKLFSESNTRWIVEVEPKNETIFLKIMDGLDIYNIGTVGGDRLIVEDGSRKVFSVSLKTIREYFKKFP